MWIKFEGMTEFGQYEIIIQSEHLGTLNKVTIGEQTFYQASWNPSRHSYYAVVDAPTAKKLFEAGAKMGTHITDYPAPTRENRCIYRTLDAVNVADVTKAPFNALSLIDNDKFFLNDVEYIRECLNRSDIVMYEVVGAKRVNGVEVEAKSVVSRDAFQVLKSLGVPSKIEYEQEGKIVFEGILDTTGKMGTVVIDPNQIAGLDRVSVHEYDPMFRLQWTYEGIGLNEYAVIDKTTAMMIAEQCKPRLRKLNELPFHTHGDRCILQSLPSIPIEQAEHRWDVVREANGRKMFYGDITNLSRYRIADAGIVATGIRLDRNFKGQHAGAGYNISLETFNQLKDAGISVDDRLSEQLNHVQSINSISA